MPFPRRLIAPAAFALAAGVSVLTALWAAAVIEHRTGALVHSLMTREGLNWVHVTTDGLQVRLSGTAPTEALRFRAMNLTASLVDAGRVRDRMEVTPVEGIVPPRFSVELLRNDEGISLIGLVPAAAGDMQLAENVASVAGGAKIADMLTQAAFPAPSGWDRAVAYGLTALQMLAHAKISIAADHVAITAISGSEDEKRKFETELARARPEGLAVTIDISAPRPVLTPFTLRFIKDAMGPRFDACAADTEGARAKIIAAAVAAGVAGKAECTIGLGVPTPRWADAVVLGIAAVNELGAGSITFSDADVSLQATVDTPQELFDRVAGELEAALPDVFSLKATLPQKPKAAPADGPAEFTATLADDGKVQLRGRLTDGVLRNAVSSFAKAHFGADAVYTATRLDPDLPDGWPVRVLAGLQAMSNLHDGNLVVRADAVSVTGVTAAVGAREAITRTLSEKLGQGQAFTVDVRYDATLDPKAALPSPAECVAALNAALAKRKITFAPGSAEIEADARGTMDALAAEMRKCPDVPMEIAGHTDAQGREDTNLALSQARAEAVLLGLQGRRVLVGALTAAGYGESRPIADNGTEAGREANRRIEFTLLTAQTETKNRPAAPAKEDAAAGEADATADAPALAAGAGDDLGGASGPDRANGGEATDDIAPMDGDAGAAETAAGAPDAAAGGDATASPGAGPADVPFKSAAPAADTLRPKHRPAGSGTQKDTAAP